MSLPRTYVYVDGFNLYFGAVKNTKFKWLNIDLLCQNLLPSNDIIKIKYFTARVSGKIDPGSPTRQNAFLRALNTLKPKVEVIEGQFVAYPVWRPLVVPKKYTRDSGHQFYSKERINAHVVDSKEKGSDVNLAVNLLNDAWLNLYDVAVVVSNDSDLVSSIRIVRSQNKKSVGFINPHKKAASELAAEADFTHQIRAVDLAAAQFPDNIAGTAISKPKDW